MDYSAQNVGNKKIRNYCTDKLLDNILISYEFNVQNAIKQQTSKIQNFQKHRKAPNIKRLKIENISKPAFKFEFREIFSAILV